MTKWYVEAMSKPSVRTKRNPMRTIRTGLRRVQKLSASRKVHLKQTPFTTSMLQICIHKSLGVTSMQKVPFSANWQSFVSWREFELVLVDFQEWADALQANNEESSAVALAKGAGWQWMSIPQSVYNSWICQTSILKYLICFTYIFANVLVKSHCAEVASLRMYAHARMSSGFIPKTTGDRVMTCSV